MRKTILFTLLVGIAVLLCPLLIPAAHSQSVEGTFEYNFEIVYQEEAHGHTILYALEHERWMGSFEGTAHGVFIVLTDEAGLKTVDLFSTFTGTVDGKAGSLVIHLIGEKSSPDGEWLGDWDIVRGIGELKNLGGQGTWGGPGYEGPRPPEKDWDPAGEGNTRPDIWYKGTISTTEPTKAGVSFGTPINLGPMINSGDQEGSPTISADGLELYFSSNRPDGVGGNDIWVSARASTKDEWGAAVNLGPIVNSEANEVAPSISADGLELYFCDWGNPRPGGFGEVDLWVTTRATKDGEWGEPVNLGPTVNSPAYEVTPEISSNGLELYFEADLPGGVGTHDLWVSTRPSLDGEWGKPVNLGPTVNREGWDHCPTISTDGLTLFYDTQVPGGEGHSANDLMVARRATLDDDWGEAVSLGHVYSGHYASDLSADGTTLYFASQRDGGSGGNDIWQMPVLSMNPADAAFKAVVEEIFATYSAANMAGDADRYMSLLDEDCVKMGPGKPAVFGKAAIDKGKRASYQAADVESQIINVEETRVFGDLGFARGTYTATQKSKKDGTVANTDGKYLTIFKKQADGSWKMFRDCYNSN